MKDVSVFMFRVLKNAISLSKRKNAKEIKRNIENKKMYVLANYT